MQNVMARSAIFELPETCENVPEVAQMHCVESYCGNNPGQFVCEALKCKQDNAGKDIFANLARLKCIQKVCELNTGKLVCKKLEVCEEKRNKGDVFGYVGCVITLFTEEWKTWRGRKCIYPICAYFVNSNHASKLLLIILWFYICRISYIGTCTNN